MKEDTVAFANKFVSSDQESTVDDQWDQVEKHIADMLSKYVPTSMTRTRHDQPWLTRELKRMCRKKHRLYRKWKKLKQQGKPCSKARESYKRAHREANHSLQSARSQYINGILERGLEEKSTKPFWRYIKAQRTEECGTAPLKENGQVHSDPSRKASILARQFSSVFTIDDANAENTRLHGPSIPPIPDVTISEAGVMKLLKGVNPSKAAGPDQIPCRILHELHVELAPVFTALFRTSYTSGKLPSVWKTAWITPVFKKGAKCEAANYRPVSLTCVACKLLEHILCSHIRNHLDKYNVLSPYQHGFRKKLSCESQLLATTHDLMSRLDQKEEIDIGVLDFSKAFDVVPHQRLMRKIRLYGISGRTSDWIAEFLNGRTQSVLVDGVRSHPGSRTDGDPVLSGVPQGTVMGPLLFLLYINDLPSVLSPSTACRLFADDCLIYRSIISDEDQVTLQRDLEALHDWGQTWGLRFNVKKCNILHLARQTTRPVRFYTLGGAVVGAVSNAKYLGVTLSDSHGTRASQWKIHITDTADKASKRLGFLRRNLKGAPYKLREIAYQTLVRSSLDYCGAIWDPTSKEDINALERVQRRAARWARGIRGTTSVTALLKELGWATLETRRRNQRLGIVFKILHGDLAIPWESVGIHRHTGRTTRGAHHWKLNRAAASDKHSPLWHATIPRTVPQWNRLNSTTVDADSFDTFKSRLTKEL